MEADKQQEIAVGELKAIISKNLPGCDLTICIFIAALKSFKADQCLRPFPQCFINEKNEKDFVSLKTACSKIPTLSELLKLHSIPKEVVDLLLWLFKDSGIPLCTIHPAGDLPLTVINKKASISTLPQYVFKVSYNLKFEEIWEKRVASKNIFYAFHGSSISNFYSILKFGLQQHFSCGKEVIFGTGIYLSDEISVCTNYSPFGETWQNSTLGQKHSIIAVCEVIDDEENVKCKDDRNKKRAINQNSYGEIPRKYFVVTNNELVKLKYLLVYRHKNQSTVTSFIKKNFLWFTIILYFLMLILIGLFNNPYFQRYLRIIYSLFQ
ncbi:protein mono-ADP-ribosyltransferase PARP16-like isoform X1 [Euwallacea fornicatus]|uniref:protein mono-ADP-ribosyltransferase PARP16-like isoform X1 n=1 Tax=Euwallacea fornicatus TaxID=995702 RepID=UPI00338E9035